MHFLIYVSSAVELFTDEDLLALLEISRRNNQARDITGLLLYKGGNFMQVLEGPAQAVRETHAKIALDTRHRGLITIMQGERDGRDFPDWSMGFHKIGATDLQQVPGYSNFMNASFLDETFRSNPSATLQLLLSFKQNIR